MSVAEQLNTFGVWVKFRRRQMDLSQAELGRLAGCSAAMVRKIEADERRPSHQLAGLLIQALQAPVEDRQPLLHLARGVNLPGQPLYAPQGVVAYAPASLANNLPAPLTSLVDRHAETEVIISMLKDPAVRWVTLLGPPGIGKTRLSIQAARRLMPAFPDGAWFVDLTVLECPEHVLPAIVRALSAFQIPAGTDLDDLSHRLRDRQALLVLDNFEHVTGAAVEVSTLLKRCPGLKILASSRTPLNIYGEHEYQVLPLKTPPPGSRPDPASLAAYEAVQLLVLRARQILPGFSINEQNAPAVLQICTIMEGIPLAIELAAANLRKQSLDNLVNVLTDRRDHHWLADLSMLARDMPDRQLTLENVVSWSYDLLNPQQKTLFKGLSVFSGWFDLDAVRAVCLSGSEFSTQAALKFVDSLADHSLLVRGQMDGTPCWRMLEIMRAYASGQCSPAEHVELESRISQYFIDQLARMAGEDHLAKREAFYRMHSPSMLSAMRYALQHTGGILGYQLADALSELWWLSGYLREGLETLKTLLSLPEEIEPARRAKFLQEASDLAWQQHDFETSLNLAREAVEIGRANHINREYPAYLNRLGRILLEQGNYSEARLALEECLTCARQAPELMNPGIPLAQLGEADLFEGHPAEATGKCHEALSLLTQSDKIFIIMAQTDLAEAALALGDAARAHAYLIQAGELAGVHIRRLIVYLCAVANYLLSGDHPNPNRWTAAASLYGAVEGLAALSGVPLGVFYRKTILLRSTVLRQRLSSDDWQADWNAGWRWDRETALRKAREIVQAAQP